MNDGPVARELGLPNSERRREHHGPARDRLVRADRCAGAHRPCEHPRIGAAIREAKSAGCG